MNQQENQDLASSLPALPRLDRLDRLVQLLEEKHGLSGRDTALKKEEGEEDESKTNLTLSSALEEVHHKGTLMERLALLETRVLQLSQISLDMDEGNTSRSSSSSGHVSITVGQAQDEKSNLQDRKGPDHLVVEEKGLTNEIPSTKKTEQSTITNKSRIKRRISLRKLLGWLRLGC
ncbi:uncharacterized protein LOC132051075 [Lycium ferocissimum]|uniref:uncharacterized protein LOC132051075 n=1 Tax=Lycium ferocissimum TaxID=112874 RepID=UPI0028150CCA|nr:uncharacterized protein LOC132051075 [Lycium ferocissimum]